MNSVLPPPIAEAFQPILGRPAWQVKKGYGSFLTLEFGEPRLEIREPMEHSLLKGRMVTILGEWHLWIYCCNWSIDQHGERLAHSESDDESIARAAAHLDGQCLTGLGFEAETVFTRFEFDFGGILLTSPYDDDDGSPDEQWLLYEPSGDVLSIRSDGRFSHGPGDMPPDEEQWVPLL